MCFRTYSLVRIFYTVVFVYILFVCVLVRYAIITPDAYPPTTTQRDILDSEEALFNQSSVAKGDKSPEIHNEILSLDNITTGPLYSEDVINPHPFDFTIDNRDACFRTNDTDGDIFLVILVKCRPNETYDRQQIRQTWGGVTQVLGLRTLTMFLIGQTTDPATNKLLMTEDEEYRDFIQEDFIDAYHNMTYKNIMGLKWVATFCPQTSYVLSIDSDMTLNIYNLVVRLIKMPRVSFAEGNLRTDPLPHRNRESKWYTPYDMYPEPTYAPFLNGACYAVSGDVAASVFKESVHVRFLQWDDVFVGLVMQKIGVEPRLSPLYEQFLAMRTALKRGIGKGLRHNKHKMNDFAIKVWDNVVGRTLRDEKKTTSPFVWGLIVCNTIFVLAIFVGCGINIILVMSSESERSEPLRV